MDMKRRIIRLLLVVFSLTYAVSVMTVFIADRLYSMSMAAEGGKISIDRGLSLLDIATKLDSTNAKLYLQKYKILVSEIKKQKTENRNQTYKQMLRFMKQGIDLCPTDPYYHMHYALVLKKLNRGRRSPHTEQLMLSEFKKAAELKPCSDLYQRIYKRNLASLNRVCLKDPTLQQPIVVALLLAFSSSSTIARASAKPDQYVMC